ncbi:MAG: FmdE family protein [Anaerolineae bacterium]|jgi:formylmethanofuran dehydrogenase subunit E|nr:FmdE family protein [Anaerolineae bacterium]
MNTARQGATQMTKICRFTVDEYIDALTEFHGNFGPGLLIGGFMVDAAARRMTEYEYLDAICESTSCLPDAIQLLTPCTVGNGWLKIVDTGRFALTLYDKKSGNGIRVSMDVSKLDGYPEIRNWFMRLVSKHEQDNDALLEEIRRAGREIFAIQTVTVSPALLGKHTPPPIALCASCGEAYPQNGSTVCPACQGMDIYV